MKVVILCGGLGTRLREETEFRPKPMVRIGNKPILWHIMNIYAHYGFRDFVLCLGYRGDMIKDFFYHYDVMNNDVTLELGRDKKVSIHESSAEINWRVTLVDTGPDTLKGARLKRIENFIDDDEFMMTYGDGVANIDIPHLLEYHKNHGKLVTVTGVNPASRFGELIIEEDNVVAFNEKPETSSGFINGGFFVFNREIFDYLSPDRNCDLEIGPLEKVAAQGELKVYKHPGSWACMDTIRDMEYLNKIWQTNNAFWTELP